MCIRDSLMNKASVRKWCMMFMEEGQMLMMKKVCIDPLSPIEAIKTKKLVKAHISILHNFLISFPKISRDLLHEIDREHTQRDSDCVLVPKRCWVPINSEVYYLALTCHAKQITWLVVMWNSFDACPTFCH